MHYLVIFVFSLGLISSNACNQKSSGKKGAASPTNPTPSYQTPVTPVTPINTTPILQGFNCTGSNRTAVIDLSQSMMTITEAGSQPVQFRLTPVKKLPFFLPYASYDRYQAVPINGVSGETGHVMIDPNTKNGIGRERQGGTYDAKFTGIQLSTGKESLMSMSCTR